MKRIKSLTELSPSESKNIYGGSGIASDCTCNCSCSCECDNKDTKDSVKDSNCDWKLADVFEGKGKK